MRLIIPEYPQSEPLYKRKVWKLEAIPLVEKGFLFETLDNLSSPLESLYPKKDGRTWDKVMATYSIVQKQVGMQKKNAFVSLMDEIEPSSL